MMPSLSNLPGRRARRVTLALALAFVSCRGGRVAAIEPIRPELATSLTPMADLEAGWQHPPAAARTRCWWWWLNGNVTKEAITRDLEAMAAKGLGGANIIDAGGAEQRGNRQVPHGPDFGSPEWRELFLHALREADRLGLELGFNIQSGWNLGGPTVEPRDAAKKLTFAELDVDGGALIERELPRSRTIGDYYVDVALIAIPLSGDGGAERVARIDNFAQKAYYEYPGSFIAGDASHLLEVGDVDAETTPIAADAVLDLTSSLGDGRLRWQAPPGRWRLIRLGYTLSGARISTHSEGWDGWAIDYLDRGAFENYWGEVIEPMLEEAGPLVGRSLRFVHTDSWELGPVNWTPRLLEEFRARRGYELARYWPVLAGYVVGDAETSTRLLNDFRRTLADLIADGNYAPFAEHAHERGLGIHPESGGPHAAPVDALANLGLSDIAMGEFWADAGTHRVRDFERFFTKQPSSAAHVHGRRLVMAESFTSIGPHWEEDPQSLKPEFDRAACEGLNLVMLHTFDCSPASMGVPGQAYFAGTHINPHVTWWRHADAFFSYLNRCQFLLQQGLPAADVLYFYGENIPSFVRLKRDDPANVLPGYDYDVINAAALVERVRVVDGKLVLPDGVTYAVLALPPANTYSLATLEHIAALVEAGARVVGPRPTRPIGLSATGYDERRFAELAEQLWSTDGEARGGAIADVPVRDALAAAGLAADVSFETSGDSDVAAEELDWVHRRTSVGDVYFVANRSRRPATFRASFRIVERQPELWDPVTGNVAEADAFHQTDRRTIVPLSLPPGGSMFVVFRRPIAADARGTGNANELQLTMLADLVPGWNVQFDPAWGGPADAVAFSTLDDWSKRPEETIKYYSGTATYETTFELPVNFAAQGRGGRYFLDLGRVENLAAVTLNGEKLGVAWTEPFRVEVTAAVRAERNELSIEVTNLWPNRLIGDQRRPRGERLTRTNVTKFNRNSPLLPAGLLGPVRLLQAVGGAPAP
jgi:hypothetical protein